MLAQVGTAAQVLAVGRSPSGRSLLHAYLLQSLQKSLSLGTASPAIHVYFRESLHTPSLDVKWEGEAFDGDRLQ